MNARAALALLVASFACLAGGACDDSAIAQPPPPPVSMRMDFARPDFFAAPFPSDDLARADGTIVLDRFPNPYANPFIAQVKRILEKDARGFAVSAAVFASLTGYLDRALLPDVATTTTAASPVALVDLDGDLRKRWPIHVGFDSDGGPYGAKNLLSALPLQGLPLPPKHRFALVVTRELKDNIGRRLEPSKELQSLIANERPATMNDATFAAYSRAIDALAGAGVIPSELAGLAVFTTGDPTAGLLTATRAALARPLPTLKAPPVRGEIVEGYCVYNANMTMPDFQSGAPPFAKTGGEWVLDAAGSPQVQRDALVRVVITVPRTPMPAAGYPIGVMIRTGGGGDRPLVDRGVQTATGENVTARAGPARELAVVGYAGASIDGPHGGPRNPTNGDEQFLMFNVENIVAIRDNVRQTAIETAIFEHVLEELTFDASDCPGTGTGTGAVRFDKGHVALIGHSMGATVAPLALAAEPRYGAAILGGAGASWIENLIFKRKPLSVRPIVELLIGYQNEERSLRRGDIALSMLQWAIEPADPLVYDPLLAGRHLLVQQGIVDHYIMPTIANAMTLSMGLDLAGEAIDEKTFELTRDSEQTPLGAVLSYSGGKRIGLPASGNSGGRTAVVRQYAEDGVQDGHEVMFQSELPKREYRCFLSTFAKGQTPVVTDACP